MCDVAILGILPQKKNFAAYMANSHRNGLWSLILNNFAYAGVGDAGGLQPSAAAGNFYVSLHTASPGEAGNQSTNEVAYPGYARQPSARDLVSGSRPVLLGNEGIVVTGNSTIGGGTWSASVVFPVVGATASTFVITHFGLGVASAGATKLLMFGALTRAEGLRQGKGLIITSPGGPTNIGSFTDVF